MARKIERPQFYEGQILASADLDLGTQYARGQMARHERYLHTWGIAEGLKLTKSERTNTLGETYQEISLSAGLAIDGTGREIVVPERENLSEALFLQLNLSGDAEEWFPVFLTGRDEAAPPSSQLTGACNTGQPTRTIEGFALSFGRQSDVLDLDKQDRQAVEEGPGDNWMILLGYVQWNKALSRFHDLQLAVDGIGPRYAGVLADEVTARGGQLTLRSGSGPGQAAVVLDGENGEFRFGLQDPAGSLTTLFTINKKGDIKAEGKIETDVTAGPGLHLQSGSAHDGMLLPLPPGISQQNVDDGKVTLHVHVSPRWQGEAPLPPGDWTMTPLECRVEGRRVFCRMRWSDGLGNPIDLPGTCDYTLTAFVPST